MKLSHKYLAAFLLLISLTGMNARAQMTSYKVLHDDPLEYKNLWINVNFFDWDNSLRAGLGGEFTLNRRLFFHGEFAKTYMPFNDFANINPSETYIEAGSIFSFSSVVKPGKMKVQFNSGMKRYSMKVQTSIHKQRGFRGGINSLSTSREIDDLYHVRSNTQSIYGGIAFMRTKNPLVQIEGYGTYDRKSRGILYIDAMFAPVITYSDNTKYEYYEGSSASPTPETFPKISKKHVGARIGYMKQFNWPIPMRHGLEVGMRPGVGNGMYFLIRLGLSFGVNVGKSKSKDATTTEPATTTPDPSAQPK